MSHTSFSPQSLSPSSRSRSKQRKGLTLHHQLSASSNNPQSSPQPSLTYRSISPNGYQLYKNCIDQIHSQPTMTQMKSQVKVLSSHDVFKNQPIVKTNKEIGVQMDISVCSIEKNLKDLKQSICEGNINQQIDIVISLYQNKITQLQQNYQRQIIQFQLRLQQLQSSITSKDSEVAILKRYFQEKISQERQNRLEAQYQPILQTRIQYNLMKQTVSGLIKQTKDIDRKLKIIVEQGKKQINAKLLKNIQDKIDKVCLEVIVGYGEQIKETKKKVQQIKEFYEEQFQKQQRLMEMLNLQYQKIRQQIIRTGKVQSDQKNYQKGQSVQHKQVSFVGINQKIMYVKEQLASHELSLKSLPDIFKMYNGEYQQLLEILKINIADSKERHSVTRKEISQIPYSLPQISDVEHPLVKIQSSFMNSPKQQIRPVSMFRSSFNHSLSMFSSKDTIISRNLSNTNKLQRLIQTFNVLGHKLPVKCVTDQTGYLKYSDSRTYIFDKNGNLFEFGKEQAEAAIVMGLLTLQS